MLDFKFEESLTRDSTGAFIVVTPTALQGRRSILRGQNEIRLFLWSGGSGRHGRNEGSARRKRRRSSGDDAYWPSGSCGLYDHHRGLRLLSEARKEVSEGT